LSRPATRLRAARVVRFFIMPYYRQTPQLGGSPRTIHRRRQDRRGRARTRTSADGVVWWGPYNQPVQSYAALRHGRLHQV